MRVTGGVIEFAYGAVREGNNSRMESIDSLYVFWYLVYLNNWDFLTSQHLLAPALMAFRTSDAGFNARTGAQNKMSHPAPMENMQT